MGRAVEHIEDDWDTGIERADSRCKELDWLLVAVLLLCSLGLVMAVSIRGVEAGMTPMSAFSSQAWRLLVGLGAFLCCAVLPLESLRRNIGWLFCLAVLGCFATHFFGGATKGAARWLEVGSTQFQPVEAARFCLVILGAHLLASAPREGGLLRQPQSQFLAGAAVLCFALLLQPDHGNTLFIAAIAGLMSLVAGIPVLWLLVTGGLGLGAIALKGMEHGYAVGRIRDFLEVETGSQVGQGLVAVASGGLFGTGLGNGWMKMGFVSEARNDFVFTIIGEEFGFVGALAVVALYTAIGVVGYRLVVSMRDPFLRLVVLGMVLVLCIQAGINMLVNVGMAPAKGIDLPFVSSGGTSLVFHLAAVGVIGNAVRTDRRDFV